MIRAAPLLLLLGLAAPELPLDAAEAPDAAAALREGNRLFHSGDLERAMETYAAGYDGTDPLLAYNLGTAAHHLERLPEALLWYRRALAGEAEGSASAGSSWLRDNLRLVREQLQAGGARNVIAGTAWSFWMDHHRQLLWTGILLAWAALPAVLLPRSARARRIALTAVAIAAGAPFAAGLLLERNGPRAAVLLQSCGEPPGRLPAGSEIRVFPADGRSGWRIPGSDLVCAEESVGLVEP